MRLILSVSAGILMVTAALGCEAVKSREPKQASDPVVQSPKYGDTKLNALDPGDDAGTK
jgi:hypothetical protein